MIKKFIKRKTNQILEGLIDNKHIEGEISIPITNKKEISIVVKIQDKETSKNKKEEENGSSKLYKYKHENIKEYIYPVNRVTV